MTMDRAARPHQGPAATQVIGYGNGSGRWSSTGARVSARGARALLDALDPARHARNVELLRMTANVRHRLAGVREQTSDEAIRRRVARVLLSMLEGDRDADVL